MMGVEPTSPYSTLTLRLPFQSFNQLNYISSFNIRLITPDIYFLEKVGRGGFEPPFTIT